MSFLNGFEKTAVSWSGISSKAGKMFSEAKNLGGAAISGAKASGSSTVGDALKLKGLSHIGAAVDKAGGLSKAVGTPAGRKALAEGVGKAAPSLAAAGAYGVAGKKLYDKTMSGAGNNNQTYYYG